MKREVFALQLAALLVVCANAQSHCHKYSNTQDSFVEYYITQAPWCQASANNTQYLFDTFDIEANYEFEGYTTCHQTFAMTCKGFSAIVPNDWVYDFPEWAQDSLQYIDSATGFRGIAITATKNTQLTSNGDVSLPLETYESTVAALGLNRTQFSFSAVEKDTQPSKVGEEVDVASTGDCETVPIWWFGIGGLLLLATLVLFVTFCVSKRDPRSMKKFNFLLLLGSVAALVTLSIFRVHTVDDHKVLSYRMVNQSVYDSGLNLTLLTAQSDDFCRTGNMYYQTGKCVYNITTAAHSPNKTYDECGPFRSGKLTNDINYLTLTPGCVVFAKQKIEWVWEACSESSTVSTVAAGIDMTGVQQQSIRFRTEECKEKWKLGSLAIEFFALAIVHAVCFCCGCCGCLCFSRRRRPITTYHRAVVPVARAAPLLSNCAHCHERFASSELNAHQRNCIKKRSRINVAVETVIVFLRRLMSNTDRCSIVAFNHTYKPVVNLGTEEEALAAVIFLRNCCEGRTHLWDAVGVSVLQFVATADGSRPWVLVILTDGDDQGSKTSLQDSAEVLAKFNAINNNFTFVIGLGRDVNTHMLTQLCNKSGAFYLPAEDSSVLHFLFALIAVQVAEGIRLDIATVRADGVERVFARAEHARQLRRQPIDMLLLLDISESMTSI